ncbi:MAG TPA: tRNA (guanosine(46)-N7)-methyltransferase TrmB [Chitinophagaceae bacterium]|nr:tRNA (guanosine(46)-N7)-methyltransferase TrmB [Chitinophagaceae bacterium]
MGQKKLIRFAELKTFGNVFEFPENMPGNWSRFFGNQNPIVLELACGKGEYALGLARLHSEKNFIGVDIKGNRIWVGAKKAIQENLGNVAFLRTQIDHIAGYFGPGEVEEIWITFPDPQLRISKAKKRLTHPKFLRLYQKFLVPDARIHLKTDSPDLYAFTKTVIAFTGARLHADVQDLYAGDTAPELGIRTHYESLDISGSNRVHYLSFSLPVLLPPAEDDRRLQETLRKETLAG